MIMSYCMQDIAFLIAKKSMTVPVIGWFARKMKCIPVERPQDLSKVGTGKLIVKSSTNISGVGTQFKKELMVGDTLKF
jgi:1-acyl-sn-glycerol-3-phosphate acyltransferase